MKKTAFALAFVLAIFLRTSAQHIIKLDDNLSFVTDKNNVELKKISEATNCKSGNLKIVARRFTVSRGESKLWVHQLKETGNGSYDFYSVEGGTVHPGKRKEGKDYDTLYFLTDDIYGFGFGPDVYLGRSELTAGVYVPVWTTDTTGYFTGIEHDTLDIMACLWKGFDFSIVFKNGYLFDHTDTVFLSDTMAPHPIVLDPVDENGASIFNLQGTAGTNFVLTYTLANGNQFTSSWGLLGNINYHVSDYTSGAENIYFSGSLECTYMGSFPSYTIQFEVPDTITDSLYLTNPPDSLVSAVSNFTYYHEREYNNIGIASLLKHKSPNGSSGISGTLSYRQDYPHPYWEGSVHTYNFHSQTMRFVFQHYIDYIVNGQNQFYIASPVYDEDNGMLAGYEGFSPNADIHDFAPSDTIYFGKGLLYYWNMWQITNGVIRVKADKMGMWGNWIYPMEKEDSYILKDSAGNVVASGSGLDIEQYVPDEAPYTLVQTNNFSHFNGVTGKTTITSFMDLANDDRTPPIVYNIYFLNQDDVMKYQFDENEQVLLRFSAADFTTYNSHHTGISYHDFPDSLTKVWIKRQNTNIWLEAQPVNIYNDSAVGTVYETDLTGFLDVDSALYDLKISVSDYESNSVTAVFRPALVYGAFTVGINCRKANRPSLKTLKIVPNPATDKITFEYKNNKAVTYEIYTADNKKAVCGKYENKPVDISMLSPGMYVVVLYNNNIPIVQGKFVKTGSLRYK